MSKHRTGFTLIELLVVIAIIALVAGLLFPVFSSAKGSAKRSSCMAQLHQLGLVTIMYRDDTGGWPRSYGLDILVDQGYLKAPALLICPEDPFHGLGGASVTCKTNLEIKYPQTYSTPFAPITFFEDHILKFDANAGILACRTHGSKTASFTLDPLAFCKQVDWLYDDKVLRLRMDGSVKLVDFTLAPQPGDQPGTAKSYRVRRLFTDVPESTPNPDGGQ